MNICLFESDEISKPLSVKDKRGEHIVKILHKKEGDTFSAGIINGMAGKAVITKIDLKEEKSADGRKTFLELSNGKYIYPLLDDFINLHKKDTKHLQCILFVVIIYLVRKVTCEYFTIGFK